MIRSWRRPLPVTSPVRIFVVGFPRSGTTLVQAILASHPDVFSLPETHYFSKIWGRMRPLAWAGVVSPRRAARILDALVDDAGVEASRPPIPRWWPMYRTYADAFQPVMDCAAARAGKRAWVDKSPSHVEWIDGIERHVSDARFIHVVRDGRSAVASFYEQCQRHPEGWIPQVVSGDWHAHLTSDATDGVVLAAIADRWNRDVRVTRERWGHERHHVVRLERLVADPSAEVRRMCAAIGVSFSEQMLAHERAATTVVGWRGRFEHMQRVLGPIDPTASLAVGDRLTGDQQRMLSSRLLAGGAVDELFP